MREQPYEDFDEWVADQAERHDPVGDFAREWGNAEFVAELQHALERGERTAEIDAWFSAKREFTDYRWQVDRNQQLRTLEKVLFDLLKKVHAETDCGRDGKHWAQCQALTFMFGWKSWEEWATVHAVFEELEP